MKKNLLIILTLLAINYYCQTITPQVINSAGQSYSTNVGGVYIADNIGEPFGTTLSNGNMIITQGFLQPLTTAMATVSVIHNDVSCSDKKDGNISVSLTNLFPNPQIQYIWTPSVACPASNCTFIDSLAPGSYTVKIVITYTVTGGLKTDTLNPAPIAIKDMNGPCKIKVYNAITANGDGDNDALQIDNITDFPLNHVLIYNRWGQLIFETHGYDNVTKLWPGKDEVNKLVSSTYFYVINLGDGSNSIKGWVEVIKN